MRRELWIGLMVIAVPLASQEVATVQDPSVNLSHFQTFAVKIGTPWGDASSESAAKDAVVKNLEAKGWKETDESSCDAVVIVHGARQGKQTLQAFYESLPGYGFQSVGAPALADSDVYEYKEGTLVIDIFDAQTKRAVFRGVAKKVTSNPGTRDQQIDKATKEMFKSFPRLKSGGQKPASPPP